MQRGSTLVIFFWTNTFEKSPSIVQSFPMKKGSTIVNFFGQICLAIFTNTFDKSPSIVQSLSMQRGSNVVYQIHLQFGQIHFAIQTNTLSILDQYISDLDKFILQFGQIHFANTYYNSPSIVSMQMRSTLSILFSNQLWY